jgi:TIR domain
MTDSVLVAAASLAPDASWAVTVAKDGTVRTWVHGTAAGISREAVSLTADGPVAVALSGNVVALSGGVVRVFWAAEGMLWLYERFPGTWPRLDDFPAPAPVRAVAISSSGRAAVVACDDGTLRGLNMRARQWGWTLATGASRVRAVAMASDAGPVVAAFADGTVRRYDPRAQASEVVGDGSPADAVTITSDGEVILTASPGGMLRRWTRRTSAPPQTRMIDAAVTALAIDGTGDRVLVGSEDGRVWLYDLTGSVPGAQYRLPAEAPFAGVAITGRALPPGTRFSLAWLSLAGLPDESDGQRRRRRRRPVDEDVRFTVYRPQVLHAERWASLLVFAHKTTPVVEPGRPPADPIAEVEARARAHFSGTPPPQIAEDARQPLMRGTRLRIVPDLPGIWCNPQDAELEWWEPVHEVSFRLLAGPELAGTVVRGAVRIWCGLLIIGEVSVAIPIAPGGLVGDSALVPEPGIRYRKIFPSYSHRDGAVVANFAEYAQAFGDQYLQDVLVLRSGEEWDPRLLELIDEADLFQLFWSRHSMRSPHCRQEWEHALALRRRQFVRPVYWEEPLPADPGRGLPPAALQALHFQKVPAALPQPVAAESALQSRPMRGTPESVVRDEGTGRRGHFAWLLRSAILAQPSLISGVAILALIIAALILLQIFRR